MRTSDYGSSTTLEEILYEAEAYCIRKEVIALSGKLRKQNKDLSIVEATEKAFQSLLKKYEE